MNGQDRYDPPHVSSVVEFSRLESAGVQVDRPDAERERDK